MSNRINPYKQFAGIFIPNWLLQSELCSLNAKVTYGILCFHAGANGECYPSQEVIASKLGVSTRSVRTYIEELESCNLIEVDQQGLRRNNRYYFLEHEIMERKQSSSPERKQASSQERKGTSSPIVREEYKENNSNSRDVKTSPNIPTLEGVTQYFTDNGYSRESAEKFFNYYNVSVEDNPRLQYWRDSKGNKVKSWKQKAQAVWFKPDNKANNNNDFMQSDFNIITG